MMENAETRRNRHQQWALELEAALPQSATRFTSKLIESHWGADIAPMTSQLAYLQYDFRGYPALEGIHQGRLKRAESLLHAAMSNQQTVGAGRFGETVFGLYTPPPVGPRINIADIDESAFPEGGQADYEGIYRQTIPQRYEPQTQLALQPHAFKRWVWTLELKNQYSAYVKQAWPADADIETGNDFPLKTTVKFAYVLAAYLQHQEQTLSDDGLKLALRGAGLDPQQSWESLTLEHLQGRFIEPKDIQFSRLRIYRYVATDIWCFSQQGHGRRLLYVPGNSSPFQEFADVQAMRYWLTEVGRSIDMTIAVAAHFMEDDRVDGVLHAGVLTALQGMAIYPRQHHLTPSAGFFNNDGYWKPADYANLEKVAEGTDPFAQMVRAMKQAALDSIATIHDDAEVNRQQLNAVVEPLVQWLNRCGPLALLIPGGEGLLALAGLIDAGYGLAETVNATNTTERSQGITRTVFGVLNALPVLAGQLIAHAEPAIVKSLQEESVTARQAAEHSAGVAEPGVALSVEEQIALMQGIGPSIERFSNHVLLQIRHVSGVSDDALRLMQTDGRVLTPILQDTISRFAIDQDLQEAIDALPEYSAQAQQLQRTRAETFHQRHEALQQSDNSWVRLFRQQYPQLPTSAVEQMLDRSGVDIAAPHTLADSKRVFSRLADKAQQYEQHFRVCRAFEGLYLKSSISADSDVLVLHTLERLPGWSSSTRIEVLEGGAGSRVIDSIGITSTGVKTQLAKTSGMAFEQRLLNVLTIEQRSALGLRLDHELADLQAKIRLHALTQPELMLGLRRMDTGAHFHFAGLRGGGFPATAHDADFSSQVMRLQVKEIYPAVSDAQADDFLRALGLGAQVELDRLRLQTAQLRNDITEWIEDIHTDIHDMDVELLPDSEGLARGMSAVEIEEENDARLEARMHREREIRYELAEELIAIWQKRSGPESRVYEDGRFIGFHLDMDFDPMHSLPQLNVKFRDVISLSMPDFQVTQRGSINGFLECFPNLRWLGMRGVDLRLFNELAQEVGKLPPAISQMSQLETLDLSSTGLVLTDETAGKIAGLKRLRIIDLSNNPLGVAPLLMGMPELRQLKLRGAGLTVSPVGIFDYPYLRRLDLRDNRLTRIPEAVRRQSVAEGNVLLSGNPLSDPDSLRWVVEHRQQSGINVWMGMPTHTVFLPGAWTAGLSAERAELFSARWERIAVMPGGDRLFGTLGVLTRTADYIVDFVPLQSRVWRMFEAMDASPALRRYLFQDVQWPALDGQDPFASFTRLEETIATYIESPVKKPRLDGGEPS
ncbi:leucine Rich Repeat (LRR)-containing protein [Pseudomonas sp. PB103]|uniref:dermonecrotic toxin domain-containing protein n=1 Tax=Pseudomonas sp. PB103 TaxID=2494698 RepID=UPI00131B83D0|nr:DUF6543 domain-containing protein [Pseudomonas sp. PB103]KAE9647366.1 leucine Rich Repeat (LRR)-containing protein [Pseudomonas sp. PB103]